ncbi:MAG: NAD-dependent epimerase/dehydratase family protein [Nitrospirae bacterium]|nr:NAD-dependent epimerase/dehydratase family protein [Nitrospirota bacterium]
MKILVTGGAGFIGSNVVDGYVREGHEVIVVDNLYTGRIENLNPGARFYLLDVRSEELGKVFEIERPDIVNHHAAQMSVPASVDDPAFDADVNIMGLINLLQNSIRYEARKFIFISSGGAIYGEKEDLPISESDEPQPLSPYAVTKLASESYLGFYRHQYGLDYTVLRYANIYGPRQVPHAEAGVVSIFVNMLRHGEVPVIYHYPDQPDGMTRDYCYVGDVVRANVLALERGSGEALNIGTSVETTTGELYRIILELMRSRGYATDAVFDRPRKGAARSGDLRRSALNIEKAWRALGWRPEYGLREGLEETILNELA